MANVHSPPKILNAVFYLLKSGCPWRPFLPRDFPPSKTVYHRFTKWRIDGTFERLNLALGEPLRTRLGRNPQPSAAIVGSQSRPRRAVWAANSEGTTEARRSAAAGGTCSWIRKARSSEQRFTAPNSPTRTAPSCY